MNIGKKAKIVLFSESQKDDMLERLERSKVEYDIREVSSLFTFGTHYNISIKASDMKKVV
ncbi:MAG: hypothetical protein K6G16_05135 [Lachnospiraceae bacterium]|nr:hypothetical protein [Lachnospiraceae bacterium]